MNISQLVWNYWEDHAKSHPKREAIVHWDVFSEPFRWTYGSLLEEALKIADSLIRRDVKMGDVCALILRHNKYFYPIYMAIAEIGAIPSVLAYPNPRLHPDKFLHGLSGMAQKSGLNWVMTERDLEPTVKPLTFNKKSSIKDIFFPLEWIGCQQPKGLNYGLIQKTRDTNDNSIPFLLQHSSGTTGLQKAVVLSHKAVIEHVELYSEAIKLSENDKIVSWLPLYHDMGLIAAFHMPLILGIPSIQIDPFQWVSAPIILFHAISKENATLTWLPNFAYNLMADRINEEDMQDISLSSMRMFINCSEVVRPESHGKFFNRFQKYGVKKESLAACYAMAETTFAVTQTEPGYGARVVSVGRDALAKKIVQFPQNGVSKRTCLSSGKPIPGCYLKIVDDNGIELPENRVGKILIKSISLFDGYRNNPEKTRDVIKNGWYVSGDIGFFNNGEYFIIGRGDDVIVVAGRNIFPEDIEDAVNNVKGIIPGRVVAFGIEDIESGTQNVCVMAETLCENKDEKNIIELEIKQIAIDIDITISAVHLVPPRWLIKSSSGKPSRRINKERILTSGIN